VSDDGQAVLLGPSAGKASHRLSLDDKLRAAVRGQLSAVGVERAEAALSPKEMQARMREGATPEEVAKEAQVPVARVMPYAAPVLAERERIVEQARAAVLHRSRGPNGNRPLGEVVDAHLGEAAGLKTETVEWTARRRRDGAWVVLLAYAARGGRRTASWLWRPVERDLTALDSSATRLASEESATARRRPAAARPAAARSSKRSAGARATKKAARRPAAKKAARPQARKATPKSVAKKVTARKPPARKSPARKAPARKAPARKPPTRKAPTRKAVARNAPVQQAAVRKAPARKPAAKKPVSTKPATERVTARKPRKLVEPDATPIRPTVVPDPVVDAAPSPVIVIRPQSEPEPQAEPQPEPQPEEAPAAARRAGQRVPLPSWSDVLLGVAPPEATRESASRRRRKSG
jgi:hypothetical protein